MKRIRASIRLKLTAFVTAVVIVTECGLLLVGFPFIRGALEEQVLNGLSAQAANRRRMVREYVGRQQERLAMVSSRTRLLQMLDEHAEGAISREELQAAARRNLLDAAAGTRVVLTPGEPRGEFLDLLVVDADGRVVAATDDRFLAADYADEGAFLAGREELFVGAPQREGDNLIVHVAGPAVTAMNRRFVVLARADAAPLIQLVGDGSDLGRTGETQLVQHSETSVELLLPSRLGAVTGDRLTSNVSNGDDLPLRGQIAAGKTGFLRARDRRGVPVLAVYEPVGYRDWGMIAKIDSAEADEPLWRLGRWTIIPATIVLLLGAVGSYVLARHFTRPIQELADTAATVASGDLNARATVHTHDELEALAQRFNEMTEKLAESHATLEHQVEERTAELNRSNRELEQFAYVASHDLQEPLRAVAGYCQLLRRRYLDKLDGDAREFLEYAVDGAERMRALIDGLLDYSRVQTQGRPFADVDCESVLDWALRNLEASLVESGAQVTRSAMPVLFGDDGQLARLMQNLIGNAIKYRGEKPPEIRIEAQERDDEWVISVADNGIGIDPKHFDRVFAIFQRLHTRDEYPGTGIGLAVCKRIVERHNGRMWVESEAGRGSVFFFTIPHVTNSQETEPTT